MSYEGAKILRKATDAVVAERLNALANDERVVNLVMSRWMLEGAYRIQELTRKLQEALDGTT